MRNDPITRQIPNSPARERKKGGKLSNYVNESGQGRYLLLSGIKGWLMFGQVSPEIPSLFLSIVVFQSQWANCDKWRGNRRTNGKCVKNSCCLPYNLLPNSQQNGLSHIVTWIEREHSQCFFSLLFFFFSIGVCNPVCPYIQPVHLENKKRNTLFVVLKGLYCKEDTKCCNIFSLTCDF